MCRVNAAGNSHLPGQAAGRYSGWKNPRKYCCICRLTGGGKRCFSQMRRDYVKELRENDRLQESISGSGCPGVLFLLKRNNSLRLGMKESGSGKTAVRMLPFFCSRRLEPCWNVSASPYLRSCSENEWHRLLLYAGCLPAIENRNSGPCLGIIIAQHFFQAADDFFL